MWPSPSRLCRTVVHVSYTGHHRKDFTENEANEAHLAWCLVFTMPEYAPGEVMSGQAEDKQFNRSHVPISHQVRAPAAAERGRSPPNAALPDAGDL